MARAYLLSHGARIGDRPNTFVPTGKSISFYSEFDQNTLRTIGLAALSAGDITPTETFEAGDEVANYVLVEFEDSAMAEHLAAASSASGGTLYFTGAELPSPAWLCTTPDLCVKPNHHATCQGIFKLISENEIYSVSCRGLAGGPGGSTFEMEGNRDFMDEMGAETIRILTWAQTEPDAAMQYYQSLSEATRAMLNGANTNLAKWAEDYYKGGGTDTPAAVVEARNYLESHGDVAFADFADQMEPMQRSTAFADDDVLNGYWLGYARRLLRNEGAQAFFTFFATLEQGWQTLLSADDELMTAIALGSQAAPGETPQVVEGSYWQPTDDDFQNASSAGQFFVKNLDEDIDATWEVGTFVVLLGEPSDELASHVRQSHDYASGTFQVERATFGAGKLVFSGVPPVHQGTIESFIEGFSDKKVKFE